MVCTFFGHSDCYDLDATLLQNTVEQLITNGVNTFYVGHQGNFDSMVFNCLTKLREKFPNIVFSVVLAYLPTKKSEYDSYYDFSIYPDGLELVHPKFAIDRRNRWMIEHADYCVCYINHTHGGAYKFTQQAKRRGLTVINIGSAEM